MRNYIRVNWLQVPVSQVQVSTGNTLNQFTLIVPGLDEDRPLEKFFQLLANPFPDTRYDYEIRDDMVGFRYYELNRKATFQLMDFMFQNYTYTLENEFLHLLDPFFKEESPREEWSHGH